MDLRPSWSHWHLPRNKGLNWEFGRVVGFATNRGVTAERREGSTRREAAITATVGHNAAATLGPAGTLPANKDVGSVLGCL